MTLLRTAVLGAAASIALVSLTGCIAGGSHETGYPQTPYESAYYDGLEEVRDGLIEWVAEWDAAGCTPVTVATDVNCSYALAGGGLLAQSAQILLQGTTTEDAYVGSMEEAYRLAQVSAESSMVWSDAGCPGELPDECAPLAATAATDLLALNAELSTWTR